VGGASLEMRRGRKIEYLDIPPKDNIKGWCLEWFIVENHGKSLPPRSGRQPDVRTPSWVESPTALEVTEARVLLAEICLLKERGPTAEAVVADFVFKNIQPLKDRSYLAYLYSGITDSTRVTNRKIPTEDLVSRLDMILRGKVSNVGAPVAFSAWNLPPPKSFFNFVSNPPAGDSGLGLKVRPSSQDIGALVASICDLPNDERQVQFSVSASPDDEEIDVVLNMLAGESSDSACAKPMAVMVVQELNKTVGTQNLRVFAQSVLAQLAAQLHLLRKRRKRSDFGDCHAWIKTLALLLLFVKKYQQRSLLRLIPMVVYLLKLTPMGVIAHQLTPMGVTLLKLTPMGVTVHQLNPMGVTLLKLTPMGVTVQKLIPMGVIVHQLLFVFLMRTKNRKKKFR
jgi:hypothetical protein